MQTLYKNAHRFLVGLAVVALAGCELFGFRPEGGTSPARTVDVVNAADENVYVTAINQRTLSLILLAPEVYPEDDDPHLLSPGEELVAEFGESLQRNDVAVFVLYVRAEDGVYRLASMVERTYNQLRRRGFRYTITSDDLDEIDLEVHLMNSFDNDRVRVSIDGREVFDGRVTTDYTVSLAEVIHFRESSGTHDIEVRVNDSHAESTSFTLDRPLFIQVRFYRDDIPRYGITEGIYFDITNERPLYD